jgi:deoxyribose-phosphate aldolase
MMTDVARHIDHTILKATTVISDIVQLCSEAAAYHFAAVCVPPNFVASAKKELTGSDVKVATVIGFPFGYSAIKAKLAEVDQALNDGAEELDIVINISALKNGSLDLLRNEINTLLPPAHAANSTVKTIIESGVLTDEEIVTCCRIYSEAGVDYLKTSTGYAESGASIHAVQLLKANLPSHIRIKASGGIRSLESVLNYINAGADRIGTSSGVGIMKQQQQLLKS